MSPPGEVEFFVDSGTMPATDKTRWTSASQVPRWALVLVVVVTQDGGIWLAGFGSATAGAVVRLDPKTLRPLLTSPVAARLGASSRIESAGDRDIWVRSAGDGEGLWCVDGRSRSILQHWPSVRGAVASVKGAAFASMEGALVPLVLDACSG